MAAFCSTSRMVPALGERPDRAADLRHDERRFIEKQALRPRRHLRSFVFSPDQQSARSWEQ
jgi:hypothetical protein